MKVRVKVKSLSRVRLFATPWTGARKAPLSVEFFWQRYWSGLSFPSPGDPPDPGIETVSPALHVGSLPIGYEGSQRSGSNTPKYGTMTY